MKSRLVYSAAVIIVLALSGPTLAGKGGGGSMGGPGNQRGGDMAPRQGGSTQRRSDKALQQDHDQEQYRGPDAERDRQKKKAKGQGEGAGKGD